VWSFRGFRAEYLDHATARDPAYAQRNIKADRTGRNGRHVYLGILAERHDGPFPVMLFDLGDREVQCFFTFGALYRLLDLRCNCLFFDFFGFFYAQHLPSSIVITSSLINDLSHIFA